MERTVTRVMRIERKGNSVRVAVGDLVQDGGRSLFREAYGRADHQLSADRHERLSAIAWVINGCSGFSDTPIETVLIPREYADELLPLLRGDDPHEDFRLNFSMLGYAPAVQIEEDTACKEKTVRMPVSAEERYLYYRKLADELMRLYRSEAGGLAFKPFTGDESEFESRVREQAVRICDELAERQVYTSEVFCRMFKKIWILKASVSRKAFDRICQPADLLSAEGPDICRVSMSCYDHRDLNGSVDFIRQQRPEWMLSEKQKDVLRKAFALMGQETEGIEATGEKLYLQNMAVVRADEKTLPSTGNSPLARINHHFGILREMEVYACFSDSYTAGNFKSGTLITEYGIFASVGFPKKNQFFPWRHLLDEGIRQEENEFELWDKQTDVRTRRNSPVTGTIHACCGELYVLLDAFVKLLEEDGYGR